jgi:hypothetical protein
LISLGYGGTHKASHGSQRKWFHPKGTLAGWKKNQSERERHGHLNRSIKNKGLLATANSLLGLANVTRDKETKQTAKRDFDWMSDEYAEGLEKARKQTR